MPLRQEGPDTQGHFHTAPGNLPYNRKSIFYSMVTATDMKRLTERWGRIVNRLPNNDLKYGIELVQLLEKRRGPELAYFDDPLEAAIMFTTIDLLKARKRERGIFDP
jgi:hypothetical protein